MMIPCEPTGIKLLVKSTPAEKDLRRMERAVQIIRNRVERWLRIQYRKLLKEMLAEFLSLDHIPEDDEVLQIVTSYDQRQMTILSQLYSTLMPKISALVVPDDTLKSWTRGMEVKALEDIDVRMQEWMRNVMGINIRNIDSYTRQRVRDLYWRADGNLMVFQNLLEDSGLFSDARARRIAVTETTSGINKAVIETSREVSFHRPMVKVWRTTGRRNVRQTHEQMEGVRVGVDERFKVPRPDGGVDEMLFPGDSSMSPDPANIVNCHCMVFTMYADPSEPD